MYTVQCTQLWFKKTKYSLQLSICTRSSGWRHFEVLVWLLTRYCFRCAHFIATVFSWYNKDFYTFVSLERNLWCIAFLQYSQHFSERFVCFFLWTIKCEPTSLSYRMSIYSQSTWNIRNMPRNLGLPKNAQSPQNAPGTSFMSDTRILVWYVLF